MSRGPDLFIIGAPKAGTTSLHEYLRAHPDVFMSAVKEPMYFSPDLPFRARRNGYVHGRDEERYMALFAPARAEKHVGESSTHYMASRMAPRLIHEFQPKAWIVCILRNPIEVAHAWHGERVFRGGEKGGKFDLALLDNADGQPYLEVARFGSQLTRWFDQFGREKVHVIVFDDFVRDTPGQFRRLLEFLEVESSFQPGSFESHNSYASKSRLAPYLRARPVRLIANGIRRRAGPGIAHRLSQRVRTIPVVNKRGSRAPLAEEVRQRLQDAYVGEVELAGRLLGRDLGTLWWR